MNNEAAVVAGVGPEAPAAGGQRAAHAKKTVTPAEFEAFKAWTIQQLALAQPAAALDSFIDNGQVDDSAPLVAQSDWTGEVNVDNIPYTGYNMNTNLPWIRLDVSTASPQITEEAGPAVPGQGIIWRRKNDQRVIYFNRLAV